MSLARIHRKFTKIPRNAPIAMPTDTSTGWPSSALSVYVSLYLPSVPARATDNAVDAARQPTSARAARSCVRVSRVMNASGESSSSIVPRVDRQFAPPHDQHTRAQQGGRPHDQNKRPQRHIAPAQNQPVHEAARGAQVGVDLEDAGDALRDERDHGVQDLRLPLLVLGGIVLQ